jgi:hypothetical protein
VLTEIRHLRQSGHTLRRIAATLNHKSLRTRRASARRLEHLRMRAINHYRLDGDDPAIIASEHTVFDFGRRSRSTGRSC